MRTKLGPLAFLALFAPALLAQSYMQPQPLGGKQAVNWLLEQEQRFPEEALAAGLKGEVTVAFTVTAEGLPTNLRVQIPLEPACDAEALRLASMILWTPASVGGTDLDHDHVIAIPFNAKRYKKKQAKTERCPPLESELPMDESHAIIPDRQLDARAEPRIAGGMSALGNHLSTHMKYPPEAYRLDIQGMVAIAFVVEPTGSVSNLRTLNFLGGGCDAEAMRLARTLCWAPAIKDDQRVRSTVKLDIQFRLGPSQR